MKEATNVVIRTAQKEDLDVLLPLVQAYRVFYKQEPDLERERSFIERHLQNGTSVIYLAEVSGTPAGFMQLFKTYSTVHLANAWILEDLFCRAGISPPRRGGRASCESAAARAGGRRKRDVFGDGLR